MWTTYLKDLNIIRSNTTPPKLTIKMDLLLSDSVNMFVQYVMNKLFPQFQRGHDPRHLWSHHPPTNWSVLPDHQVMYPFLHLQYVYLLNYFLKCGVFSPLQESSVADGSELTHQHEGPSLSRLCGHQQGLHCWWVTDVWPMSDDGKQMYNALEFIRVHSVFFSESVFM